MIPTWHHLIQHLDKVTFVRFLQWEVTMVPFLYSIFGKQVTKSSLHWSRGSEIKLYLLEGGVSTKILWILDLEGEIHSVHSAFMGMSTFSSIPFFIITCPLLCLEQDFLHHSMSVPPATVSGNGQYHVAPMTVLPSAVDSGCWEVKCKELGDSSLEGELPFKRKCVQ